MTHISAEEFQRRHAYCIPIGHVQAALRDTLRRNPQYVIKPGTMKAVCDHPEDGVCCGPGGEISSDKLVEVNARLAGIPTPVQAERAAKRAEQAGIPKRPLPEGLRRWMAEKAAAKLGATA